MLSRPVLWLAALAAASSATPASASYLLTPYGGYMSHVGPFGGYGSYAGFGPSVGYGYNPYFLAGGFGVSGAFTAYGPYSRLPVGAYAAYRGLYAYNGLYGSYSGGYVPQVGVGPVGYFGGFGPYNAFGYNFAGRYNAYPSAFNYAPALYYGQQYASYLPFSGYGYGSYAPNAYSGMGYYRSDGFVGYDPGPMVSAYRGPSNYVSDEPPTPPTKAIVTVDVPQNAKVWFGGVETKQTGTRRSFISPTLEGGMGQYYKYEIKAAWQEDGKPVERSQTVYVKAGERSNVLFNKSPAMASAK